jgi:hypothetical protein
MLFISDELLIGVFIINSMYDVDDEDDDDKPVAHVRRTATSAEALI